jgi:butyrate kinase
MSTKDQPQILVINPGSTSTKVALFAGHSKLTEESLSHSQAELAQSPGIWGQFTLRLSAIQNFLTENKIHPSSLAAVVGRGGLLKPLMRGTYLVNQAMIEDAHRGVQGEHVSNLGCALAEEITKSAGCPAYIVDPVSVDEFEPLARYSGHPLIERRALSHALNLRAAAIWAAEQIGVNDEESNFVVAHLGGGISIAPIKGGRIIDVNDASSDGPFSPERSGGLPLQPFIDLCFSGQYTRAEMQKLVMGKGGLVAYLGTHDVKEIEARIDKGDQKAGEVFSAMAYQIAKEIAAMFSVLCGEVKAIVLTGGLAKSERLVNEISRRVEFIAPVLIMAGELEMEAMAAGVLRVLQGKEMARDY